MKNVLYSFILSFTIFFFVIYITYRIFVEGFYGLEASKHDSTILIDSIKYALLPSLLIALVTFAIVRLRK